MSRHHVNVPEDIEVMESSSDTAGFSSDYDNSSSDSDEELLKVHAAVAPPWDNASIADLRQASTVLIFSGRRQRELLKQNALLEASAAKGQKKLTHNELEIAIKGEAIRLLGRKYSITHCLWINPQIFPLRAHPNIDVNSKERWLSPLSIEDGVKAELFLFVPEADQETMNHKLFGSHFAKGVGNVRSEMVSDIKTCAGAIFGLNPEFFLQGYDRGMQEECCILIRSPHGSYTRFAPVLFPCPNSLLPNDFLKSAVLVKILKVSIHGKTSLSSNVQSSKTKAKIWNLRATTPGMIAAAAIVAIYMLSGNKELLETCQTTKIPYRTYHDFYHERLMTGGAWACQVLLFFNQALFPSTSSLTPAPVLDEGDPAQSWELDFEHAIDEEGEPPITISNTPPASAPPSLMRSSSVVPNLTAGPGPVMQPDLNPAAIMNPSISTAMEALDLAHSRENINKPVADDSGVLAAKPKPKPKWKGNSKHAAAADGDLISANTGVQRSNRHGKEV
ncbi:hypothetical protein F4604DRAFT_1916112 [Suillus subluteus]|nr:hypothetical protein F4604DRAFT_1916112 [Suillus subluteus]